MFVEEFLIKRFFRFFILSSIRKVFKVNDINEWVDNCFVVFCYWFCINKYG